MYWYISSFTNTSNTAQFKKDVTPTPTNFLYMLEEPVSLAKKKYGFHLFCVKKKKRVENSRVFPNKWKVKKENKRKIEKNWKKLKNQKFTNQMKIICCWLVKTKCIFLSFPTNNHATAEFTNRFLVLHMTKNVDFSFVDGFKCVLSDFKGFSYWIFQFSRKTKKKKFKKKNKTE